MSDNEEQASSSDGHPSDHVERARKLSLTFSDLSDGHDAAGSGSRRKRNEPASMDNTARSRVSFAVESAGQDGPSVSGSDRSRGQSRGRRNRKSKEPGGMDDTGHSRVSLAGSEMLRRASIAAHKMTVDYETDEPTKGGGLFSFSGVAVRRRKIAEENNPQRSLDRRQALVARRYSVRSLRKISLAISDGDSGGLDDTLHSALETVGIKDDGLSAPLCAALFINLISIGYLSLPWAFNTAGTVLSTIGFALVMLQTFITAQYVLEACARSHALASATERMEMKGSIRDTSMQAIFELSESGKLDLDNLDNSNHPSQDMHLMEQAKDNFVEDEDEHVPHTVINRFKAEMPELCRLFLGRRWFFFFLITISLDLYGLTWSYASIFASGLADVLPLHFDSDAIHAGTGYHIYILIFAGITVPLSCIQLSDHILIQLTFLGGRVVMFLLMLGTVAAAWVSDVPHFDTYVGPAKESGGGSAAVPLFHFPSLYLLIQVSIFSTAYQFAVPGIADAAENKKSILSTFATACVYIFITVLLCGVVLSLFFGDDIKTSANLNWDQYHGGTGFFVESEDGTMRREGVAKWAKAIAGYIVVFPALDALAVFPLCTISLGEILQDAWEGERGSNEKADDDKSGWKKRLPFRLVGCVPQIVGAAFVSDLSVIANYAGLATILSYTVCPALLAIYSKRSMKDVGLSPRTHYETMFSSDRIAWSICIIAIVAVLFVIISSALAV